MGKLEGIPLIPERDKIGEHIHDELLELLGKDYTNPLTVEDLEKVKKPITYYWWELYNVYNEVEHKLTEKQFDLFMFELICYFIALAELYAENERVERTVLIFKLLILDNFWDYFDDGENIWELSEDRIQYWMESRVKHNGKELIRLVATASHIVFYDELIGAGKLKEYNMTIEQVRALRKLLGEDKFLDTTLEWRNRESYLLLNRFFR